MGATDTITGGPQPDLGEYDLIMVNSSAGKDSQACLDVTAEDARRASVLDRVVVVHADLGSAEWPETKELAAEHAAHYGLPFHVVAREKAGQVETILDRVDQRGMFPDAARRWCTSDHKRAPVRKLMTRLVAEMRDSSAVTGRPVRVLNVLGFRAEESAARRKRAPYEFDQVASNGKRHVDTWLPIHGYTTAEVWDRIRAAGTRPHWAYAAGMTRLSCRFCVLASRADLLCSARLNPGLARRYAEVEARTGHRFRRDLSMAEIIAEAGDVATVIS